MDGVAQMIKRFIVWLAGKVAPELFIAKPVILQNPIMRLSESITLVDVELARHSNVENLIRLNIDILKGKVARKAIDHCVVETFGDIHGRRFTVYLDVAPRGMR